MEHVPLWEATLVSRFFGMGLMVLIVTSASVFGLDHWLTLGGGLLGILGWILLSLRSARRAIHNTNREVC